ncbi:MAG: hypothetical protein MJZ38_05895, partial [archaeon]|nr:hypothetical protein [archaeon]
MTKRLRNHPSLIIRTALPGIILGGLLNFTLGEELGPTAGILALCIIGLFALYGALVWSRTWLTMEDDHAVWECDLVSRRRVVIPYA